MWEYFFHIFNGILAASLSVMANTLLIYLTKCENNPVLRAYQRMIVTLCINDLIFTLFVSIGLQQVEYVDGYAILFTYTPLRHLGINAMHTICFFHLVVLTLASTTILLIFHFRYQMVCNHHIMSPFEIYRFMFLATLWAVWDSSLALYAGHTTKAENPGIELTLFANHPDWWENGIPLDLPIIHRDSPGFQILLISGPILVVGSYSGALYFGYSVHVYLQRNFEKMSAKTRRLQASLNKVMIVQVIMPFISCLLPISMVFGALLMENESRIPWIILGTLPNWIPVLNPISTIVLVGQFRRQITKIFWEQRRKSVVSIVTM